MLSHLKLYICQHPAFLPLSSPVSTPNNFLWYSHWKQLAAPKLIPSFLLADTVPFLSACLPAGRTVAKTSVLCSCHRSLARALHVPPFPPGGKASNFKSALLIDFQLWCYNCSYLQRQNLPPLFLVCTLYTAPALRMGTLPFICSLWSASYLNSMS